MSFSVLVALIRLRQRLFTCMFYFAFRRSWTRAAASECSCEKQRNIYKKKKVWVNNNMPTKHYIRVYMRMQNSAVIVRRSLMARQTSKYDNQQSQDDGALDGM